MSINFFGFSISRAKTQAEQEQQPAISPPPNDDGALTISSAAYYGTYVDLYGTAKNEIELISRYREMAMQPEIESAIDDIVNEAIVYDDDDNTIKIVLDRLEQPSKIKKAIEDEFDVVKRLYNYQNMAHDIFRRFYIDGRLFYQIIINKDNPLEGIKELRYIDPRKIRKIREIKKEKDESTGVDTVEVVNEYYLYNDKSLSGSGNNFGPVGVKITKDSVVNVNSGLMDSRRSVVLSYLHKAIKPLNQLRMIEDATVIYRISRAPERRIFYIDVGNLPKLKAEQYLRDIMIKYKNKLVYDANTGEVRDDRKFLSMMEDFWLPRRDGGKGTEITTLPGGQNLGELKDVEYFEKKLYKALNVPISRLESAQGFTIGRSAEITRDELKFSKFIDKLRLRFNETFLQPLKIQCVLKGICTADEFEEFKQYIGFDYIKDNNFTELKDAELMRERLTLLSQIDPYTGRYYSINWIRKNVLRLTDDEIEELEKEIEQEIADGKIIDPMDNMAAQQMVPGLDGIAPRTQQTSQLPTPPQDATANKEKKDQGAAKKASGAPRPKSTSDDSVKKESVELNEDKKSLIKRINSIL